MEFSEDFTCTHEQFEPDARDAQNAPIDRWLPAVERKFVTAYPVDQDELIREEQSGLKWHLDMLTLTAWAHNKDKVTIGGEEFAVVGDPDDFTHHPWGFPGGFRTRLRMVRG